MDNLANVIVQFGEQLNIVISFFTGVICALAFVVATRMRWF